MVWSSWLSADNTPERVKEVSARPRTSPHDEVSNPQMKAAWAASPLRRSFAAAPAAC